MTLHRLRSLADIPFDLLLLDVWGVLHDGERLYPEVNGTLAQLRDAGRQVLLLSNAAWREGRVLRHLESLGIDKGLHCGAVTSGDVTRAALASGRLGMGPRYWFVGRDENADLLAGLHYCRVSPDTDADFVLLTDPPAVASAILDCALARDLPLVCVNPDARAPQGSGSVVCPGTVAIEYRTRGGRVLALGKPCRAIFDVALARKPASAPLVCGDGVETDLAGAWAAGLRSVWMVRQGWNSSRVAEMLRRPAVPTLGILEMLAF